MCRQKHHGALCQSSKSTVASTDRRTPSLVTSRTSPAPRRRVPGTLRTSTRWPRSAQSSSISSFHISEQLTKQWRYVDSAISISCIFFYEIPFICHDVQLICTSQYFMLMHGRPQKFFQRRANHWHLKKLTGFWRAVQKKLTIFPRVEGAN